MKISRHKSLRPKISLPQCQAIARKFKTLEQWQRGHPPTYLEARRRGWVAMCTQHM